MAANDGLVFVIHLKVCVCVFLCQLDTSKLRQDQFANQALQENMHFLFCLCLSIHKEEQKLLGFTFFFKFYFL